MNFLAKINTRWSKEELFKMSSLYRVFYLIAPLIIYFIVGDIVEVILWAIINAFLKGASGEVIESMTYYSPTIKGVIYGIGLACSLFVLYPMSRNEITYVTKTEKLEKSKLYEWGLIVFTAVVCSVGLNYAFYLLGMTNNSSSYVEAADSIYGVNFIAGVILYGICSPVVEEVIFRGILYNRLKRMFPVGLSIVLASLLFGIFHGNIVQGLYGILMGIIITVFYEKYKRFQVPVLMHIVANLTVYVLSYLVWK